MPQCPRAFSLCSATPGLQRLRPLDVPIRVCKSLCLAKSCAKFLKQFFTMCSHLGMYLTVGMTAPYTCLRTKTLKSAISRALPHGISQHPSPSAIPIDIHGTHRYIARIAKIDLERVVTFIEANEALHDNERPKIREMLEDQHNGSFTHCMELLPFWRILSSPTLQMTSYP